MYIYTKYLHHLVVFLRTLAVRPSSPKEESRVIPVLSYDDFQGNYLSDTEEKDTSLLYPTEIRVP